MTVSICAHCNQEIFQIVVLGEEYWSARTEGSLATTTYMCNKTIDNRHKPFPLTDMLDSLRSMIETFAS